jgi:Fe-S cluster assembly protein SufD
MGEAALKTDDRTNDLISRIPQHEGEAGWASNAREAALTALQTMGAPGRRDEYWRFTNPEILTQSDAPKTAVFHSDEAQMFEAVDRLKLTFVDGVFRADMSDDLSGEGIELQTLDAALKTDIHWSRDLFGSLEAQGQAVVPRPLAALNTAAAVEGLVIRVTGAAKRPVSVQYLHEDDASDGMVHHVIKLEPGASFTFLEAGPGASRFNSVMEVDVADTASFHHVRTQGRDHERRAATHIFGRLGKESVFRSFTMTVNGVLTRNEAVLEFTGDDAQATIAGASAGDGKDYHQDDTVFVTHDAVNCESRQVFKKVLRNGAIGVFQGKILVQPDAQKTDGYQISQGLLLDDDSQFLAKPELEIYADDVACSHGSTVGSVDEDMLFYLKSRGVPQAEAQDMLVLAFLDEAIQEIDDDALADDIRTRLGEWMARHRG